MIVLDWFEFLITIINRFKDQPASIWDHMNTFAFCLATTETREGASPPLLRGLVSVTAWWGQCVSRPHWCLSSVTRTATAWWGVRTLPQCAHPGPHQWQPSPEPGQSQPQSGRDIGSTIHRPLLAFSGSRWPAVSLRAPMVGPGPRVLVRPLVSRLVCRVLCPDLPLRVSQCSCVCTHMCQPLSLCSLYHCLLRISTTLSSPSALPSPSSLCIMCSEETAPCHELKTVQFIIDDILHWFMTLQRNSPRETSPFKH